MSCQVMCMGVGGDWALVRSEFTVLMACGEHTHTNTHISSVHNLTADFAFVRSDLF